MRSLAFLFLLTTLLPAQSFDLVITNGKVFDGAGNPWYYGDIGVRGDTIAAIGKLSSAQATVRIDAKGMAVAPGFIDIHSHGRRGLFDVPTAENYLREGVTTIIEGPDGSSPLPLGQFLQKVSRTPISVNFASFVGHGSIRTQVMGLVNRKATPDEIEQMKKIARQAMEEGAVGLSTGLFYVPGNYADTEEVIEIAKVVGPWADSINPTRGTRPITWRTRFERRSESVRRAICQHKSRITR